MMDGVPIKESAIGRCHKLEKARMFNPLPHLRKVGNGGIRALMSRREIEELKRATPARP